MNKIDVVIPVMNEAQNLTELVKRVAGSLEKNKISYGIIFIDDFSIDSTKSVIAKLKKSYPIKYYKKIGKIGKAYSILQGAKRSGAEYVAMIDGDLQYAPEYLPEMLKLAQKDSLGVVIGERTQHHEGRIRQIVSKVGHFIYAKAVLGLNFDTQSGLKLFKRSLLNHLDERQVMPWAFDLPLLTTAIETGEKIGTVDIDFQLRKNGKSKINFIKTTWQIVTTALRLRFGARKVFHLLPEEEGSMVGAGVIYKRKKFITHTTLHHSKSALVTFTFLQKTVIATVFFALIAGLFVNPQATLIAFIAILSAIYFLDVLFGLFLVLKSLHFPPEIQFNLRQLKRIKDNYLPIYTILSPLYKEAGILPQFVKNIENLDWPKDKLDVILLLEEDDRETIEAARAMNLPEYFRILEVPESLPKTKPKACNYGLAHAKGEYVVIYDAEDMPEREQLKKAFLGFQNVNPDVFCLQAKLNYYNPNQNLLTRLFTAEYSLWFDIVLPGLQAINTTIPLGGTSNHFRTADLKKLEGWDPFNVAEDADLGARLFRAGYKTAIIDSITLEEANSNVKNWIRQRSRWIKGYLQTYFVQMRSPVKFAREQKAHYLIFQLVNGLRVSFMVINPILWAMTLAYFLLYRFVGPQIEALYPAQVFYMAVFSAVFGNFLYVYYYMIGAAKREEWGIIKYVYLVPFYWLLTSIGAFVAFYQLVFKPHYWEKTVHGLNKVLAENIKPETSPYDSSSPNLRFVFNLFKNAKKAALVGGLLMAASVIANFLNFLYSAYLGRTINIEDFGLLSLFTGLLSFISIPTGALQSTITFKSAYLLGKYDKPARNFWSTTRRKTLAIFVFATLLWVFLSPTLSVIFKSPVTLPFYLFAPALLAVGLLSVDRGFLTGNLEFNILAAILLAESVSKLLFALFAINIGQPVLVYASTSFSLFVALSLTWYFSWKTKEAPIEKHEELEHKKFPKKFFIISIISTTTYIIFMSADVVLAKYYLSATQAGQYALLSLVGKMIIIIGGLPAQFLPPIVSKIEGNGRSPLKAFYLILGAIAIFSMSAYSVLGIFGGITLPLLFGAKIAPILPYVAIYGGATVFLTLASNIVYFHQIRGRSGFVYFGLLMSILEVFAIVIFHRSIGTMALSASLVSIMYFILAAVLHFGYEKLSTIITNLKDFFELFTKVPQVKNTSEELLRILIFNWRDTKHVWSGGAEVYIQELGKRWVDKGHKVTIFCGNDGKNPRNEKVDGVQIIRRGGFYTVYLWAFLYYALRLRKYFDIIIDNENGIPFFTPLYARKKIFLLIHHVHQDLFRIKLNPPLSWIGKYLEKQIMPMVYQNTEVITVSPSSKADILEHKISTKDPHVIYNGVDLEFYKPGKKAENPTVLYLGRLTQQKSLSTLIKAAKKIINAVPKVEIIIAGHGQDKKKLMKLAKKLGLEEKIQFLGRVSEEQKLTLYQKAWVFVNPSLIEGWGITTIEANACGTPVVASNVAGLRDSVHNPHSGLLVPYGDVNEFAKSTIYLLKNKRALNKMSKESIDWAKKFDWDQSAKLFLEYANDKK